MTLAVAILALAATSPAPFAITVAQERLPLPAGIAASLVSSPFERRVLLNVPRGQAQALARRFHKASKACPETSVEGDAVVLRCRTERLRASIDLRPGLTPALDLRILTVLPWRPEEEGAPLPAFDPVALGLGACAGGPPQVRGECALAAGEREEARRLFAEAAAAGPAPLANLRLGDLALADDDPERALFYWRRARHEAPYERLVAARACELDPGCLASEDRARLFDPEAVPRAVRADLALRAARLTAFAGELTEAARALGAEWGPRGACQAARSWCRHVLALALAQRGAEGAAALGVFLATPAAAEGAEGLALLRAAAAQAEAAGAPAFAATLLAARSGEVAPEELSAHLSRVAGLYLAGSDRARAEEIFLFARTRLGAAALQRPEWARLRRALRPDRAQAARGSAAPPPELGAAQAALEAARLLTLQNGAAR